MNDLIEKEITGGIPADRVVLAGFSQGGAIALYGGLTLKHKLAGIMGLSTYLPLRAKFPQGFGPNKSVPVLMCHGEADMVVDVNWGRLSSELLKGHGVDVNWKTYPGMGHSTSVKELKDIVSFLKLVLP